MSQVPQTAEPQTAEPAQAAAPGTSGGAAQQPSIQDAQFQQQLQTVTKERDEFKARAEELGQLDGWRRNYTWASQAGIIDAVSEAHKQYGKPEAFKDDLTRLRALDEQVKRWGGIENLRAWEDLYGTSPTGTAQPGAAAGEPQGEPLTVEKVRSLFEDWRQQGERQQALQADLTEVTQAALRDAGLVKDGAPVIDAGAVQAMVEAKAKELAKGRDLNEEDIGAAGQHVLKSVLLPLRGAAAQPAPSAPAAPPIANARGPGAQAPSKSLTEMTPAERRQHALAAVRQVTGGLQGEPEAPEGGGYWG